MLQVALNPWPTSSRVAFLNEPCGQDELGPHPPGSFGATALVTRLLIDLPASALDRESAATMTLADRDRLVAAVHGHCFGDKIASQIRCRACQRSFEIDFSLAELLGTLDARVGRPEALRAGPDEPRSYTLADGTRFRLPAVEDERSILGLPPEEATRSLLGRCVLDGDPTRVGEVVQEAMASLAPLVGTTLDVRCAECETAQTVDFDMPGFFTAALARERPILLREVHCLARAYGWSCAEILSLPRSQRRALVALVLGEHAGEAA